MRGTIQSFGGTSLSSRGGSFVMSSGGTTPAPTITSVTLDNTTPTVGDSITATVVGTNIGTTTYQWQADGVNIPVTDQVCLTTRADAMGHALTCIATAHGAGGDSAPFTSDPTSVCTGVPVNTVAPLNEASNGEPCSVLNGDLMGVGAVFLGNLGTWTGFPVITVGVNVSFLWNDVAGDTAQFCMPGALDISHSVKCTVTASNGIGPPVAADSNAILVGA